MTTVPSMPPFESPTRRQVAFVAETPMREPDGQKAGSSRPNRAGFGLKSEVQAAVASDYHSGIIDRIRATNYHLDLGSVQIYLAREFGFCYGVERAVDHAYQTRLRFPDRRIFLTTEIIHNPGVNRRLIELGVGFLSGRHRGDVSVDDLQADDVVILPAFGVSLQEIERLRARGCTLVDTTCGSVIHVWRRVENYATDGFTSVIHGKYSHEETVATCSRITKYPNGRYIVVRDRSQADMVCRFIRGEAGAEELRVTFREACSPGFDPTRDLVRIGVANQTTMLSAESLSIADMLREAIVNRYGQDAVESHFRSFETICSATQKRQDAIHELTALKLDLILVVGGFNSSNTSHLIRIASESTRAYHIEDVTDIVSVREISHKRWDLKDAETAYDWLPAPPVRIGFTAGASTPNRAIGEVIERVVELCGAASKLHCAK